MCTDVCTAVYVHGRVRTRSAYTSVYMPVHTACRLSKKSRTPKVNFWRTRVHGRIHGPYTAATPYGHVQCTPVQCPCTQPGTRPVHGRIHRGVHGHPLPRYSVIAADTLRDLVTLIFDLLTLVSGHTWRVTWSTPLRSLKILRLSVLELRVLTSIDRRGQATWRQDFRRKGSSPCQYISTSALVDLLI